RRAVRGDAGARCAGRGRRDAGGRPLAGRRPRAARGGPPGRDRPAGRPGGRCAAPAAVRRAAVVAAGRVRRPPGHRGGRAGARRDRLLGGRGVPGGPRVAAVLLTGWLAAAAEGGLRASPAALPALLDLGRRHAALRPAVALVAGRRGTWLAQRRPEWRYLLGE